MDSKKYVTLEMLDQYNKKLMTYIKMRDELMLNGFTTCPDCGTTLTSIKCENCASNKEQKPIT